MRSTGYCKWLHYQNGMLLRIAMFVGLQIMEIAALKTTKNLLESSWWTGELVQAGVAACGKADSFWKNHTSPQHDEPTRWQLVFCTYNILERHTKNMWSQRSPTQNHWTHEAGRLVHSSTGNFKLWFIVLQRFVRSIRSGNFPPYTQSLTKLVHWFFSLIAITTKYDGYQFTSVIWWLCLTCTPRVNEEVDVQQTRYGMCHYWLWKMSRSRIVQECRRYPCKMLCQ